MTERDHRLLLTVALVSALAFGSPVFAEPTVEAKSATSPSAEDDTAGSTSAKTRTSDLSAPSTDDSAAKDSAKKEDATSSDTKPEAAAPTAAPTGTAADSKPQDTKPADAKPEEKAASQPETSPPATASAEPSKTNPIVEAVRTWLKDTPMAGKVNREDLAAATEFYNAREGAPLWVTDAGFTSRAKSAMDEMKKADDWGLEASAFALPEQPGTTPGALAEAEGKLTLELLKYVRFARGGRVLPSTLSRILDQEPPLKDPKLVMTELEKAEAADAYLRDQHPKHEQFKLLKAALLKARGPAEPPPPVDEALSVKIPSTKKTLKVGVDDPAVSLLRKRLKVKAADPAKETVFDDDLEDAVRTYQSEKGLKSTGQLSNATRQALNSEAEPNKPKSRDSDVQRIVLNMERWRWMPEDLGSFYVWNNIPEFYTRVIKNGEEVFKEKIIVGMPSWATPVFSAKMQFVTFNPSWGMPDGIKARELAPRLRQAGGGFFLFGGGGGGSVLKAYGLNVYKNGKQVDADSIDWSNADLRNYSFIQPPGAKNPLGVVKFRFPNKHDVYMHDTIQRELFNQSYRAMSHGCIRVQNPKQFAAVVLAQGNGLSPEETSNSMAGGGEIMLKNQIPVHMTYFTVVADKDGKLSTYADLYGHDGKLSSALTGKYIAYDRGPGDVASADDGGTSEPYPTSGQKKTSKKVKQPETIADAISSIFSN